MSVFDGSLESQFAGYTDRQRERVYAFQRRYGAVRVTQLPGDRIRIEGLTRGRRAQVVEREVVKP